MTSTTTTQPATSTTPPVPATSTKELSETDNRTTLNVKVGDHLRVVLHSTYWQFSPVAGATLHQVADPAYAPELAGRIPGLGSGTVTVEYMVEKSGMEKISASRVSCGEALRCVGNQGMFSVTINASK